MHQDLAKRYFLPEEDYNQFITRLSKFISQGDKHFENRYRTLKEENLFWENSPFLMNAGTNDPMLSACFVLDVPDDMFEIFSTLRDAVLVSKYGGGVGFDFSDLRPKNSSVKGTGGVASGPVSFISAYDASMGVVKQGGKRRGACMGILRADHPDILEFINAKDKEGTISNFNLSVALTDEFMQAAQNGTSINAMFNNQVVGVLDAKEILDMIAYHAWKNGEPGVIFLDAINRANCLPHLGPIKATNACSELPLLPNEACNLGSINLEEHVVGNDWDFNKLENTARMGVRILDRVIDLNKFPLEKVTKQTLLTRKIGLGVMGFHAALIKLGVLYNSKRAVSEAKRVMSFIYNIAQDESMKLARELGVFPAWQGSNWQKNNIKIRNGQLTCIAPTGSISRIAQTTSGIEPIFALSYKSRILDSIVEECLPIIKKNQNKKIETAHEIPYKQHIAIQAAFQNNGIDGAVSKTINLSHDATKEDILESICLAWETGCKGVALYRDGSREIQVLNKEKEICPICGQKLIHQDGCKSCPCGWSACSL